MVAGANFGTGVSECALWTRVLWARRGQRFPLAARVGARRLARIRERRRLYECTRLRVQRVAPSACSICSRCAGRE